MIIMGTTMPPKKDLITDMYQRLEDISVEISWREIANRYFGESSSWLYPKLNGRSSNGDPDGFTPEEAERLRGALCDLSDRIRKAADRI